MAKYQKSFNNRFKQSNISPGLSKSLVNESKRMDSTRILEPVIMEVSKESKRRCFEKMGVRKERVEAKCGFEVEVIDDTALIEVSGSVSGVKKGGFKKECDGKMKKSKGGKKRDVKCSVKGVNEKKVEGRVGEDRVEVEKKVGEVGKSRKCDGRVEKKVLDGKSRKVYRKKLGKVKAVYQRKDGGKIPEKVETCVEDKNVVENVVQETEVDLNLLNEVVQEKESTVEVVETETVNEKDEIKVVDTETAELVETESVNMKDDIEVQTENVCENPTVKPKKIVYSRGELEALRFVNEEGQKRKWIEVYGAFPPLVAKEYAGLVVDVNTRLPQRYNYRMVNCGSGYTRLAGDAILGTPPVLPMCSSLVYRRIEPYNRVGFGANFY